MRVRGHKLLAVLAVLALVIAGCDDGGASDDQQETPPPATEGVDETEDQALDDLFDEEDVEDPNDDIEDGIYRGNGVVLPVPEGWSLDQAAFAQGLVAAVNEDGSQQMTAQAIDTEQVQAEGQELDVDTLISGVRDQIGQEAEIDEEVQLEGAEQAHRLTYLDLPPQREGGPTTSVTIVIASDGSGLIGEFAFSAIADSYDSDQAELLLDSAGFDPDSEPPAVPGAPAPEGEGEPAP